MSRPPAPLASRSDIAHASRDLLAKTAATAVAWGVALAVIAAGTPVGAVVARFVESYHAYPVGPSPASVAAADLDGDGRPDVVVADSLLDSVYVFLNNGDGTLRRGVTLATGARPTAVVVGEFDEQGGVDLVVACAEDNNAYVYLGDGGGGFLYTGGFGVSIGPRSVLSADMNGDTHADLVLGCEGGNVVTVLLGAGNGFFGAQNNFACGLKPSRIEIADLNGDAKPDVVVANAGETFSPNGSVGVLLGTGSGALGGVVEYAAPLGTDDVAVTSLDADNHSDLIYGRRTFGSAQVMLRHGLPGGTFGPPLATTLGGQVQGPATVIDIDGDLRSDVLLPLGELPGIRFHRALWDDNFATPLWSLCPIHPRAMAPADFDLDGRVDLAVISIEPMGAGPDRGHVAILIGNGDGSFGPAAPLASVEDPMVSVAGHLNGDALPDFAVTGSWPGVSVFRNLGARRFEAQTFTLGYGTASVAIGDLNGDGRADLCAASAGVDVSILDQLPDYTLGNLHGLVEGIGVTGIAIADLDGDLVQDLVFSEFYEWAVVVRRGLGGGAFAAGIEYIVDGPPGGLALADFNGDTHLDAATVRDGGISLILGDGLGGFGTPLNSSGGMLSRAVTPATAIDINRDGALDLVAIARDPGSAAHEAIACFLGKGDGTFDPPRWVAPRTPIGLPAVADLDRNGVPDLAVPLPVDGTVHIYSGHGTGTFEPGPIFQAIASCQAATAADLDGDDWPDLIVSGLDRWVTVLYNARGPLVDVASRPGGPTLSLAPPQPNPARDRTLLSFTLPSSDDVELRVHDVTGRQVRHLRAGSFAAGRHLLLWNLEDERGEPVTAGVYFATLRTAAGSARRRIVVLP